MADRDIKPEDIKPEDIKPEDIKPEDIKPNDIKPKDIKPEDIKPENPELGLSIKNIVNSQPLYLLRDDILNSVSKLKFPYHPVPQFALNIYVFTSVYLSSSDMEDGENVVCDLISKISQAASNEVRDSAVSPIIELVIIIVYILKETLILSDPAYKNVG